VLDELEEPGEDVDVWFVGRTADILGLLQIERLFEYAELGKELLQWWIEQVDAPGDRRLDSPLAVREVSLRGVRKRQASRESVVDDSQRDGRRAGCTEFDVSTNGSLPISDVSCVD